jgi:hypothetical protein
VALGDVGMVEGGEDVGFALEPGEPHGPVVHTGRRSVLSAARVSTPGSSATPGRTFGAAISSSQQQVVSLGRHTDA